MNLERLLANDGLLKTISSAKQVPAEYFDRPREVIVNAAQVIPQRSIESPASEGMIVAQAIGSGLISFSVTVETLMQLDPGPHFDHMNAGRISTAAGLGRVIGILQSEQFKRAIQGMPDESRLISAAILGSLSADYRFGHQMLSRISTRQFENPVSALAAHAQARIYDSMNYQYRERRYQYSGNQYNNNNGQNRYRQRNGRFRPQNGRQNRQEE